MCPFSATFSFSLATSKGIDDPQNGTDLMVENFDLMLLAGGYARCTPQNWNKQATNIDQCFKLYFPTQGDAMIRLDGTWQNIKADRYYFINGFHIQEQRCPSEFVVYWIHFIPTSLELRYLLLQGSSLFSWSKKVYRCHQSAIEILPQLFKNPESRVRNVAPVCRVHAMLLHMVADYLRQNRIEVPVQNNMLLARIMPSIDFINDNIYRSPPLAEVAARSHLAPTYFHRLFRELFHTTPLAYMTRRRMDNARQLLSSTVLSVKEIAWRVGYENEFYFTRVFSKHFHISPRDFRKRFIDHA